VASTFVQKNLRHYDSFRKFFLLVIAGSILLFNFTFKKNIQAVGEESAITTTNLLNKHNEKRLEANLPMLTINDKLSASAQMKAEEMLKADCWSHYCPEGKSPWEFFNSAGYNYIYAGENLAEGFYSIDVLMNAWMNSQSHKDNILNPNFAEIGFGLAYGNYQGNENNAIVVVHFGKAKNQSAIGFLEIIKPFNGEIITTDYIDIEGEVRNINEVSIYVNNNFKAKGNIADGLFTSRVSGLEAGEYELLVNGIDGNGNLVTSNVVDVQVRSSVLAGESLNINRQDSAFSIDPAQKDLVNFILILGLALIFLIDFIILSRTNILTSRSYSHYHFAVLLIAAIVVLIGGISGHISNGIGI